jgi:hypothetical protein
MTRTTQGQPICPTHDTSALFSWPPCETCGYWKADYRPEWQRKLSAQRAARERSKRIKAARLVQS